VKIRTLLADDHRLVRQGLRALLERQSGIEVVGEASTGREAVTLALRERPDVVLMDLTMPELNGIEATQQVVRAAPEIRILALSMHADRQFAARALAAGASGYLLKDCAPEELLTALECVAGGRTYLSPAIADLVVSDYVSRLAADESELELLSSREREVLQLLAEGSTTKQIAGRLHVSVKTVETHRKRIMDKLGVHSVAELVKYAIQQGLTSLTD